MKKIGILLCVLLISLAVIGCSSDNGSVTIGGIEGPREIYDNEEWADQLFKVDADGDSYQWIIDNSELAEFETPEEEETRIKGLKIGDTTVRVKVDGTILQNGFPLSVIGKEIQRWLGSDDESLFHAVAYLPNENRYLAAGFDRQTDRKPYAVMGEMTGKTRWQGTFEGEGRLYGVQDVIADYGLFSSNHEYYLIGYSNISGDNYQGYLIRVDEERKPDGTPDIQQTYIGEGATGDVYLRSGVGVQADSSRREFTKIVVVGNYDKDNDGVLPYIAEISINPEDGEEDDEFEPSVIEDESLSDSYYNLEEITIIADDNKPDDGYLIAGFAGSSRNNSKGIVMKLDENLNLIDFNTNDKHQLYSMKRINSNKFIVGGANTFTSNGNVIIEESYVAIVNGNGEITSSKIIGNYGLIRGIEETDDGDYLLVTGNGKVIKIGSDLEKVESFGENGIVEYGTSLFDITKSENGYVIAGQDRKDSVDKAYVVKINNNGDIVENKLD